MLVWLKETHPRVLALLVLMYADMSSSPKCERIRCYSTLLDDSKTNTSLFRHPIFSYSEDLAWPPPNWKEIDCWHCCSRLDEPPVPLVQSTDPLTERYVVYGIFCSFSCAKAHIFESQPWSAGDKLLLLDDMAATVFGVQEPIVPAPPRIRLKRFGGDLDLKEFKEMNKFISTTFNPPLISFPETYEREAISTAHGQPNQTWTVRNKGKQHHPDKSMSKEESFSALHASCASGGASSSIGGGTTSNTPYGSYLAKDKPFDISKAHNVVTREDAKLGPGTLMGFIKTTKAKTKRAP